MLTTNVQDGDSYLDLLLGQVDSVELYRNKGGSEFVAVYNTPVTVTDQNVHAVALGDLVRRWACRMG